MRERQAGLRLVLAITLLSAAPVFAQGGPARAHVVFAGLGAARYEGTDRTFDVGIGSEIRLAWRVWCERRFRRRDQPGTTRSDSCRRALLTRFAAARHSRPYVRGGYTLGIANGIANMIHLAAGLDQGIGNRFGLRYEIRDYTYPDVHLTEFAVGLVIRSRRSP